MATIKRFEDLKCWQNGRLICQKIQAVIEKTALKNSYKLKDQIDVSSGSIMDNIAEGFGRNGNLEFIHFLTIATGSCNECQSQLYRVLDRSFISQLEFEEIYDLVGNTRMKVFGLIEYLQQCDIRGIKFLGREPNKSKQANQSDASKP